MATLQNKRIILGITGGIAAYKSAELCRLLIKAGAEVRVVMTAAAQEFITPLTLQALSGNRVSTELLDTEAEAAMGHIELARWADLILIAPASANFIARLAHGEGNDLLTTLCLARRGKLAIAPAMNQAMWSNTNTQHNIQSLADLDISVLGPGSGEQACGDNGPGRMLEPVELCELAGQQFSAGLLDGINVTITAGPTREAIDPVRYISNHSSGLMGYALAQAAVDAGATVRLVSGPVTLQAPERLTVVNVNSAAEMLDACVENPGDIFIAVAAVADYRVATPSAQKIKKQQDSMTLKLVRNPDILGTIAAQEKVFSVGFAAETENLADYAIAKLKSKKLDLIFANDATATFGRQEASVTAYWSSDSTKADASTDSSVFAESSKSQLGRDMIALISERYRKQHD